MTDDEPEPFFVSTDPVEDPEDADGADGARPDGAVEDAQDAADAEDAADTAPVAQDEAGVVDVGDEPAEDLDALVAAARAAVAEVAGVEDAEHTSDAMWGDEDGGAADPAAVWDDAATAAAENVWDLDDVDGASVWGDVGAGSPDAGVSAAAADPGPDVPAPAPPPGRPAAAEGMHHLGDEEEEPDTFAFSLQGDATSPQPAAAPDDEEPETFRFAAGADAPAPVADPDPGDVEDEPEAFTFAVDAGAAPVEPTAAAVPVDPVGPAEPAEPARPAEPDGPSQDDAGPVAAAAAADGDEDDDDDDDIWTFSMARDDSAPLAEAARPRDDSGWRDLEAAQEPRWAVPDLPLRQAPHDDEDEPAAFAMSIDTDEDAASALDDLLEDANTAEATSGDPDAPTDGYEPGALADLDLDHLDDMVAAAEAAPGPAADDDPAAGDGDATDPDGDHGDEDGDRAGTGDAPLDAPTAARQVMEPGQVTFSSSRKKRRGLFG